MSVRPRGGAGVAGGGPGDRAPERLAAAVAILVVGAAAVVAWNPSPAADPAAAAFHRLVSAPGGGPALSLVPCAAAFEGATDSPCEAAFDPLPGGRAFCPHHGGVAYRGR